MNTSITDNALTGAPPANKGRRAAAASLVGAVVDWYDYFLYGTASALIFGPLFFPGNDPVASQLLAFATFAIGFFFRPIGSLVFGHFGDRIGRKQMLVLTLLIMGAASVLIGFLPTYNSIGVWAPILLIILRAAQGFAVGGEWAGATLMAVESAPEGKKTLYGSVVQSGAYIGILTANGAYYLTSTLVTPDQAFLDWGWRIPFIASIIVIATGFIIRRSVGESEEFTNIKKSDEIRKVPFIAALKENPKSFLIVFGMRIGENVANYIILTFAISYATKTLGVDKSVSLTAVIATAIASLFAIPFIAKYADKHGPYKVYVFGAAAGVVLAFPFFWGLETRNFLVIILSVMIALLAIEVTMATVQQPIFTKLFSPEFRYSGAGFSYQITAAVGGGVAPLIATWLVSVGNGASYLAAAYMAGVCAISLITTLAVRKRIHAGHAEG